MKISKIFHFLYFSILSIPLFSGVIFAIYSMNHEITGNSVTTGGYEIRNKYETNEVNTLNDVLEQHIYHIDSLNINYNDLSMTGEDFGIRILAYEDISFVSESRYLDETFTDSYNVNNNNEFYVYFYSDGTTTAYFTNESLYQSVSFNEIELTCSEVEFYLNEYDNLNGFKTYLYDTNQTNITKSNFKVLEYVYNEGIVLDDEDIMSQFMYCEYNFMDKYLPMYKYAPFDSIYQWIQNTFFGGASPLVFTVIYQWFAYWLLVSLFWLIFDVLIYVPMVIHRWLDKGALE